MADLLQIGRQLLPRRDVERGVEAGPDVVGQAAILLHLEQLGGVDQHQRVFLPVHDAGLQRAVDLVEIDRGRRGAEMAKQRDQIGRDRQADLEAAADRPGR